MIDVQLYIGTDDDGYTLMDVSEDLNIPLTRTINDVTNFFEKKADFTKDFDLPDSAKNRETFENLVNLNVSQNVWNNVKVRAVYYINNQEVFRGFISLNSIDFKNGEITYRCTLIGNLKSLFIDVGDDLLEELDFGVLFDHKYNFNNIFINNDYDADTRPYLYIFADYANQKFNQFQRSKDRNYTAKEIMNQFRPAMFVYSLWSKIFEQYGYTFESDFIESSTFKNILIPFCNKEFPLDPEISSNYGSGDIRINDILPKKIKIRDFLVGIIKAFNLYLTIDPSDSSKYIIKTRKEYYLDGSLKDWTDKVAIEEDIKIDVLTNDNRFLNYKFNNDDDYFTKIAQSEKGDTINQIIYETGNILSTNEKDINTIFDSHPMNNGYISNNTVFKPEYGQITPLVYNVTKYWYPYYKVNYNVIQNRDKTDDEALETSGSVFIIDSEHKPRLVFKQRALTPFYPAGDSLDRIVIKNENGTPVTVPYYCSVSTIDIMKEFPYDGKYYSLNFEDYWERFYKIKKNGDYTGGQDFVYPSEYTNLYDNFWKAHTINSVSKDARKITCKMRLTPFDIFNFNFSDKVYIDFGDAIGGNWFLVNKIKDYTPFNDLTEVELLKVIDPTDLNITYQPKEINLFGDLIFGGEDRVGTDFDLIDGGEDRVGTTYGLIFGGENTL